MYTNTIPADDAERLPITLLAEWFRSQERTNPGAAAQAAALLLAQIGERAQTHVITGAAITHALASSDDAAADPENIWEAACDAEHRICEHYPFADMADYLVLPYDTRADEIAALCGECTAYITNAERPDDGAYAAALNDFDRDIHAAEQAPRLRMHYGLIEAEHTGGVCSVCGRDLFDSPDDGCANIWAY